MSKNEIVEHGFDMTLSITKIGSIVPGKSGKMKGNDGVEFDYSASIKFRTTNVELVVDEELGLKESQIDIVVKIPCMDNELKLLNEYLRNLKQSGEILNLMTTFPRPGTNGIYTATSLVHGSELLLKSKTPKKA